MRTRSQFRIENRYSAMNLKFALMVCVCLPHMIQAQERNYAFDLEAARTEILSTLELQYQVALTLPFTPMTEASLSTLDMAISGVSSASDEELAIMVEAGYPDQTLMTNVKKLDELVRANASQPKIKNESTSAQLNASFECEGDGGYIEWIFGAELARPPGPCNQSDTQVVDIDYLPVGNNVELHLSDNEYPEYPLCVTYTPPEITALLLLDALAAENLAMLASRLCNQAAFFGVSGGNAQLGCIPTDLINLGFKYLAEGVQYCNDIRGASEGRTSK